MVPENFLKSIEYTSEATQSRLPYAIKKYATDGHSVPLKKNWCETWCTLPANIDKCFNEILNFDVRDDDVFVVTFMKSGTTWMQAAAWLLLNNLDFQKSSDLSIVSRSPYLEFKAFFPRSLGPIAETKDLPSPRLIKTHIPANLLPVKIWEKKQKVIYVARNVKDVIVSSFHFMKSAKLWRGSSFSQFVEDFLNNEIVFTHYWSHVIDFWRMRHEPFICFVTYEEMKRDLAAVLQRLCCFLERPQLTKAELEKTVEHLSFDNMKKNKNFDLIHLLKDVIPEPKEDAEFIRRGIVGSFKDELTPELIERIDKWSAEFLGQYGIREEDIFGKF